MKVVVFGGSGFVGSHVADALSEKGYLVKIFDLKPSLYLRPDQEMVIGDILDSQRVKEAIRNCDYVYNFAGISNLNDATTKSLETVVQNIKGTTILLEAARQAEIKRFIYASTAYVYSNKGGFYRCSKQAAELYIEEYQRKYGLDYTILRYGSIYGPRADARNSIYGYLWQALTQNKIVCNRIGEELREYIHVRDVAKLSVDILSEEYNNKHIIITGHHPVKFKEIIQTIGEMLGNKVEVEFISSQKEDDAHYNITPYSFIPKIGHKLVTNYYVDTGQGLLECLHEIYNKINRK